MTGQRKPLTRLTASPLPLYHQLQQALVARIDAGEWKAGDQLPTIRDLCEQYGISRITVVQALNMLARRGLVTSQQGKGVFVAEGKIEHGPVELVSFTEDITRRGHVPTSRVLALRTDVATPTVAERLECKVGAPVVVLERLRVADDVPMGVQRAFLPARLFGGLAAIAAPIDSLYRLMRERYGTVPTSATETYEPQTADHATAALLGITKGSPVFAVTRVTRDQHNNVIEYVTSVLRGDRYTVVLRLAHL